MIPLEKAMAVSNSLLQGAKTIHSIRDGLEVMKEGLNSETENLRKRREGEPPVVVVSQNEGASETTIPSVPSPATTPDQGL